MKWIVSFCILCFFASSQLINAQVDFYAGSYSDLQRQAERDKKPFFVFFHADWCKPCKQMEKEVFEDKDVGQYVSANYLAYHVDGEATQYKQLVKDYWVTAYPTIILFDKEGNEITRVDGYRDKSSFLDKLKDNKPGAIKTKFSDFR